MNISQWTGNWHRYCDAREESKGGDEGGGTGSDHVDAQILVTLGLTMLRRCIYLLDLGVQVFGSKAFAQDLADEECLFWGA